MGTSTPHASALLELNSTNKGLLLPRVADTSSVNNPAKGLLIFTNTHNKLWYYDGTHWQQAETNATGTTGIWYELNDSTATADKSYISINHDDGLIAPQARYCLRISSDVSGTGRCVMDTNNSVSRYLQSMYCLPLSSNGSGTGLCVKDTNNSV